MLLMSKDFTSPNSPYAKLYPMTPPVLYTGTAAPTGTNVAIEWVSCPDYDAAPVIYPTQTSIRAG